MISHLFSIITAYFTIDFISGIGHWIIDQYLPEDQEFGGETNADHHKHPSKIAERDYFEVSKELYQFASILYLAVFLASYIFGYNPINIFIVTFFVLGVNVNYFHKMSHMRPSDLNIVIRTLQYYNILLSRECHGHHHNIEKHKIKNGFDVSYCLISDLLNPVLDYINFWSFLESVVYYVSGLEANRIKKIVYL